MSRGELPEPIRRFVAEAWAFRFRVEREAELRFRRLAERLDHLEAAPAVVDLARRAEQDERRHAVLCRELALAYGHPALDEGPVSLPEIAPDGLSEREKVLYEVVAACCITETESTSVLTTLLPLATDPQVRHALREIARDEVAHGKLGWAHLAHEREVAEVAFLASLIPVMLSGTVKDSLFEPGEGPSEDPALLQHGVLPHAKKREVFCRTLVEVVFPGLEACGVDPAPGQAWLERRAARARSA